MFFYRIVKLLLSLLTKTSRSILILKALAKIKIEMTYIMRTFKTIDQNGTDQ